MHTLHFVFNLKIYASNSSLFSNILIILLQLTKGQKGSRLTAFYFILFL